MSIKKGLEETIGVAPEDLLAYLEAGEFIKSYESRINCLSYTESKDYSDAMNSIPEYKSLGLWVLDDANDSNPYCYVAKGSCKGSVIHFCHDDDQNIKFSSLETFLLSLKDAVKSSLDIDDIEVESNFMPEELRELHG